VTTQSEQIYSSGFYLSPQNILIDVLLTFTWCQCKEAPKSYIKLGPGDNPIKLKIL